MEYKLLKKHGPFQSKITKDSQQDPYCDMPTAQKKHFSSCILEVQKSLETHPSPFLFNLEKSLVKDFNDILKLEEEFWALKSHINFVLDGDKNTKFFHQSMLTHRRRNKILAIRDSNNNWIFDEPSIKTSFISHYSSLFSTATTSTTLTFPPPLSFPQIDSVTNKIDKLNRDFLWGTTSEKKKIHSISWDNVAKPKKVGGLSIRQASLVNKVNMAKLNWRLHSEKHKLWAKVLNSKPRSKSSILSPTWKGINKEAELFKLGSKILVRNGLRTSFWFDNWLGPSPLRSLIEGPFTLSDQHLLTASPSLSQLVSLTFSLASLSNGLIPLMIALLGNSSMMGPLPPAQLISTPNPFPHPLPLITGLGSRRVELHLEYPISSGSLFTNALVPKTTSSFAISPVTLPALAALSILKLPLTSLGTANLPNTSGMLPKFQQMPLLLSPTLLLSGLNPIIPPT
ncbi:hypothetical protein ACSBR1_040747 [Camellia fascicularis]